MVINKFSPEDIPLLEFDPDTTALIEPQVDADYVLKRKKYSFPEYCVMPIYSTLFDRLTAGNEIYPIFEIPTPYEKIKLYELNFQGKNLVIVNPGMGAPLAALTLEVMIALGCRKFIACGSCGVLKAEIKDGVVIIPASALRDEGVSYHYLSPSRTVEMNPLVIGKLEAVLQKHHIHYETGKTWTTDAIYRETKGRIAKLKEEGCIAVEMECAALLSVAKFRDVLFGQYITASDDVSGNEWDRTIDHGLHVQEKLFWLSVEACLSL
jgi:uridine phosphorylase